MSVLSPLAPLADCRPLLTWTAFYCRPLASGRFTVYAPDRATAEAEAAAKLEYGEVLERLEGGRA